jgi:hypothetical protein
MAFGLGQQLQQPQFGKGGDRQQIGWVGDQIADADLHPVQIVGPFVPIRTHRGPQMAHVLHAAGGQLGLHPVDVVLVVAEQRHRRRCQGKLQPTLRMGSGRAVVKKRRTR